MEKFTNYPLVDSGSVPKTEYTIGQWADYIDTGIWSVVDGRLVPPPDLTESQLKDFKLVFGELVEKE